MRKTFSLLQTFSCRFLFIPESKDFLIIPQLNTIQNVQQIHFQPSTNHCLWAPANKQPLGTLFWLHKHDEDRYDCLYLPFDFSLHFASHLSALSIAASPGSRMEVCGLAHCFDAPTISLFFIASGYTNKAPFGTHTNTFMERRTNRKSREREKWKRMGGGEVKQTNDSGPCFQSNPLFVFQDLYS